MKTLTCPSPTPAMAALCTRVLRGAAVALTPARVRGVSSSAVLAVDKDTSVSSCTTKLLRGLVDDLLDLSTELQQHHCRLDHRAVFAVGGRDAEKWLQGLLSNNVLNLTPHGEQGATSAYAFAFNPQGRLLYDSVVYRPKAGAERIDGDHAEFWLDCDAEAMPEFIAHLKKFKLRAKVKLEPLSDAQVWSSKDADFAANGEAGGPDPRVRKTVHRVISCGQDEDQGAKVDDTELYTLWRYSLGIAEGPAELPPGKALPLECNGDFLHGVSFEKGCYVGQELTARTHHTGVIRKRLMPFVVAEEGEDRLLPGTKLVPENGKRSAGTIRAQLGCLGLAMVRLQHVKNGDTLTAETDDGSVVQIYPRVPSWWDEDWASNI
eukprot:m.61139 g.61139  ORF g.61139 m.61139 type:complete len:377 (-) comp13185_c0_seq1:153-1283(-)